MKMAADVELVVSLEESGLHGGIGSAIVSRMREAGVDTRFHSIGVPQQFFRHGSRSELHAELGLTADDLVIRIATLISPLEIAGQNQPTRQLNP